MRRSIGLTALLVVLIVARTISVNGGSVKSSYWKVSAVSGRTIHGGATLAYCPSQPLTLTAVDVLARQIPTDEEFGYELLGPPTAGDSVFIDGGRSDGQTVVAQSFSARDFPTLRRRGRASLPPGTYTYLLRVSGATASRLILTLVPKPGC